MFDMFLILNYNHEDQILMILRNMKWDLPKGKLEQGEDIKECAIREVEEECGLHGLKILRQLMNTYHIYTENGENIIKRTFWFRMKTDYNGALHPQKSEGIDKAVWLNKESINEKLDNTFGNIKDLLYDELY